MPNTAAKFEMLLLGKGFYIKIRDYPGNRRLLPSHGQSCVRQAGKVVDDDTPADHQRRPHRIGHPWLILQRPRRRSFWYWMRSVMAVNDGLIESNDC